LLILELRTAARNHNNGKEIVTKSVKTRQADSAFH
jgi:hypothetical protein